VTEFSFLTLPAILHFVVLFFVFVARFSSEETVWDLNDNAIVSATPANRQVAIQFVETLGTG
jgi:hypothetical protein